MATHLANYEMNGGSLCGLSFPQRFKVTLNHEAVDCEECIRKHSVDNAPGSAVDRVKAAKAAAQYRMENFLPVKKELDYLFDLIDKL